MKTLTRLLQTAAIAVALGGGSAALADPSRSGPNHSFGERPGYGRDHGGREQRSEHRHWDRGHWRPAPLPFVALPRLVLPLPALPLPPLPVPPFILPRLTLSPRCFWPAPPVVYVQPAPVIVRGGGGHVRVIVGPAPCGW